MFQPPFTCSPVIRTLLLILTKFLAANSDQEFDEAYYKPLKPGYSYGHLHIFEAEQHYPRRSLLECTSIALNSQSEFFTYNKVSHLCKNYSPKSVMTVVTSNDNNEISFYRSTKWMRVYAISMGAGSKVYDAFFNHGNPLYWNVDKCSGIFCPNFFRHPLIDFWNHLSIDVVKLVVYKNQTSVVKMVFDGQNTTIRNWFSFEKLKESPWSDITQSNVKVFSITGHLNTRRFYISSEQLSCETDEGWFVVTDGYQRCPWQNSPYYPRLYYAEGNSENTWHNGHGEGDSMAIFISLKPN